MVEFRQKERSHEDPVFLNEYKYIYVRLREVLKYKNVLIKSGNK